MRLYNSIRQRLISYQFFFPQLMFIHFFSLFRFSNVFLRKSTCMPFPDKITTQNNENKINLKSMYVYIRRTID